MSVRSHTLAAALALAVATLAGCGPDATAPGAPSLQIASLPAAPVALEWQEQARALVAANRLSALAGGRVYAALSVAQHRAMTSADAGIPAGAEPDVGYGPGGRSGYETGRGAVAGASARVLGWLFPAAAAALEQRVAEEGQAGAGGTHPHFARGVAIGRAAGDGLVTHLQNDGFTAPWTGTVPAGPGMWIPNALPPAGVMLGDVTPYLMTSGSQFRPAPPPAFGSAPFQADVDELLAMTTNITPEQIAFARGWDYAAGTPTTPGYWNALAATYVAEQGLDERGATEVFALMHAAMFDALIGCWEAKYHYWTLRPSQADPAISLVLPLPNFPSYPSGHSCASSSGARVLAHFFPGHAEELAGLVEDAGLSRMLAGIHYRFDIAAGQELGRSVAEWAIARGAP